MHVTHSLNPARVPTHDPLVGRVVGQMMAGQAQMNKPEEVHLSGHSDSGQVKITFKRQDDGSVSADGYCGSVEIHESYAGVNTEAFGTSDKSRLFGVAGNALQNVVAKVSGTVGGEAVDIAVTGGRSQRPIQLTEELRAKSPPAGFSMGSKIHQSPAFGGASVTTYTTPNQFPTETTPIETTDNLAVRGKVGKLEFGNFLEWKTTSWATVWNTTDGWNWQQFHTVDSGKLREQSKLGQQETRTEQAIPFEVAAGPVASGQGSLVTTDADGKAESVPLEKNYQTLREKGGVVHVEERYGEHNLEFDIYTLDSSGARVGIQAEPQREEQRVSVG
ncbi:MAG: hypothetical protein KC910_26680 [Candidatus Eremiobacteraeota bacterium]|nr:hypothetical protein [Candidatus Eremiobacteraeota bacterium]